MKRYLLILVLSASFIFGCALFYTPNISASENPVNKKKVTGSKTISNNPINDKKEISSGPHKSGVCLPGFRPHIAWDIEQNMLLSLSFYRGAARATTTIKRFFQREILEIFDADAIEEVYMDSEYTSMDVLEYFVERSGYDIEVTMCLKKNKKIMK